MKTVEKISILILCIYFNMSALAQELNFKDLKFENGVFAEWKTLKYGYGEPGNIPDINGSKNGPILKQLTSGGISTSTGNIYNPRGISQFKLTDTVDFPTPPLPEPITIIFFIIFFIKTLINYYNI